MSKKIIVFIVQSNVFNDDEKWGQLSLLFTLVCLFLKKDQEKHLKATQEEAKDQLQKYMQGKDELQKQLNLHAYTVVIVKSKIYLEKIN
jgi:hypothetical protein